MRKWKISAKTRIYFFKSKITEKKKKQNYRTKKYSNWKILNSLHKLNINRDDKEENHWEWVQKNRTHPIWIKERKQGKKTNSPGELQASNIRSSILIIGAPERREGLKQYLRKQWLNSNVANTNLQIQKTEQTQDRTQTTVHQDTS